MKFLKNSIKNGPLFLVPFKFIWKMPQIYAKLFEHLKKRDLKKREPVFVSTLDNLIKWKKMEFDNGLERIVYFCKLKLNLNLLI